MGEDAAAGGVEDNLRGLLGDGPLPFPEKSEREFQPWHRPRKQYVRTFQWSKELRRLARDLELDSELRYLTLPGNDLLDIRHLVGSVCSERGIRLKYLGFNSGAFPTDEGQSGLNSAEFSIHRMKYIDPESQVFPGDFRQVGEPRSMPWQRVRESGPFHAINLDLCGGFAGREKAVGIPNYFTALQALLQNQASSDLEFLLFITTRMDDDSIDPEVKEKLGEVAQQIHDTCKEYAIEFAAAWGLPTDGERVCLPEMVDSAEAFMLGLTQWIVSQGITHGLKASVKSFLTYRTGSGRGDDDIVSLAIRFKPDPFVRPDAQGLVKTVGAAPSVSKKACEQSALIPKRVSGRIAVDEILRTQAEKFDLCLREATDLLTSAGYNANTYRDWVMREADRYAIP